MKTVLCSNHDCFITLLLIRKFLYTCRKYIQVLLQVKKLIVMYFLLYIYVHVYITYVNEYLYANVHRYIVLIIMVTSMRRI